MRLRWEPGAWASIPRLRLTRYRLPPIDLLWRANDSRVVTSQSVGSAVHSTRRRASAQQALPPESKRRVNSVATTITQVPIIVNNRDRLNPLRQLIGWLERAGQRDIYIVDNDSTYPPLLAYYRRSPYTVIRLGENVGHVAAWTRGIVEQVAANRYYVVTDPDIVPVKYCPINVIDHFHALLDRYPDRFKVGFGLKIDDLPAHYRFAAEVKVWEGQFWAKEVEPGVYDAPIDTTFALYRPGSPHHASALRTGEPYVARHTPWYAHTRRPDREERYYRGHARADLNHWDGTELPDRLYAMMNDAGVSVPQPPERRITSLFQQVIKRR